MFRILIEIIRRWIRLVIVSKVGRKNELVLRSKIMSFSLSFKTKKTLKILAIFGLTLKNSFLSKL
jgi:hypothetical protein